MTPSLKMNTRHTIPQIGFGMWMVLPGFVARKSVAAALQAGYRHFDTAQAYHNEQHLGRAIKDSGIKREELFITTKIKVPNLGYDDVIPTFEKSLGKLRTDYVDLLLIHFPETKNRAGAWKRLEEIHKSGRAKSIGVSNYMIHHLEELLAQTKIVPAVNQIELHAFLQMPELVEYCQKKGIVVEAYSPLAHGKKVNHPILDSIAKKYGKTDAQIMLRWCLEIGAVPLPKSTHAERIQQNIDIFDFKLDKGDMAQIATLESNYRTCWDPTQIP